MKACSKFTLLMNWRWQWTICISTSYWWPAFNFTSNVYASCRWQHLVSNTSLILLAYVQHYDITLLMHNQTLEFVCMYIYTYTVMCHACLWLSIYMCTCMCAYVHMCVCMHKHTFAFCVVLYVWLYMCVCCMCIMCVLICMLHCLHTCIYVYM